MASTAVNAYATVVLHCLKYNTQPLYGLLLGKRLAEEVYVAEALPVQHSMLATAPSVVVDTSLMQAAAIAKAKGLAVVGCYFANERADDTSLSEHSKKVVKHIAAQVSPASAPVVVWVVDNTELAAGDKIAIRQTIGGSASPVSFARWNGEKLSAEPLPGSAAAQLTVVQLAAESSRHAALVDFEDHLDDVSRDFTNAKLFDGL